MEKEGRVDFYLNALPCFYDMRYTLHRLKEASKYQWTSVNPPTPTIPVVRGNKKKEKKMQQPVIDQEKCLVGNWVYLN